MNSLRSKQFDLEDLGEGDVQQMKKKRFVTRGSQEEKVNEIDEKKKIYERLDEKEKKGVEELERRKLGKKRDVERGRRNVRKMKSRERGGRKSWER